MHLQIVLLSVALIAVQTLVIFDINLRMNFHMLGQISILSKSPSAYNTNEGFFTCVDTQMVEQIPCFSENLSSILMRALENSLLPKHMRGFLLIELHRVFVNDFEIVAEGREIILAF
jgi:hypothetical protein